MTHQRKSSKMCPAFFQKLRCQKGFKSKTMCFIVSFTILMVAIIDFLWHLGITILVSKLYCTPTTLQCPFQMTNEMKTLISTLLGAINLGTHGFYVYPSDYVMMKHFTKETLYDDQPLCQLRECHIDWVDSVLILLNIYWVMSTCIFVVSLRKECINWMKIYIVVYKIKMIIQVGLFMYEPFVLGMPLDGLLVLLKILDLSISIYFLLLMRYYLAELEATNLDVPQRVSDNIHHINDGTWENKEVSFTVNEIKGKFTKNDDVLNDFKTTP